MRTLSALCGLSCFMLSTSAFAQEVELNHLDCIPDPQTQELVCPEIVDGRSSAVPVAAEPAPEPTAPAQASSEPAKGSEEWNAYCAGKYKSFDPATGNYRSFSGKIRPCV